MFFVSKIVPKNCHQICVRSILTIIKFLGMYHLRRLSQGPKQRQKSKTKEIWHVNPLTHRAFLGQKLLKSFVYLGKKLSIFSFLSFYALGFLRSYIPLRLGKCFFRITRGDAKWFFLFSNSTPPSSRQIIYFFWFYNFVARTHAVGKLILLKIESLISFEILKIKSDLCLRHRTINVCKKVNFFLTGNEDKFSCF